MTVPEFIAKWRKVELKERSAAQEHFLDLCNVFDHPTPAAADPIGESFCFEKGAAKHGGGDGFADVWKRGFFGIEYKGRHKDLAAAYDQLLRYRDALENPPLLVVCGLDPAAAHFLDRIVFCLFAEDTGLLPEMVFTRIVSTSAGDPGRLGSMLGQLFDTMATGGYFGAESIRHFNGNLFDDRTVLELTSEEVNLIATAARLKKRTLTNLYNERPAWLAACHVKLDAAVAAAYGWPADLSDEAILERLLALNQAEAGNA